MSQKLSLLWTLLALPSLAVAQTTVRLAGTGSTGSQGRVEVLHQGQWGTICNDEFGPPEVGVICRMLGYNNGGNFSDAIAAGFGQGTGPIWMDNLQCDGTESNIDICLFGGWNNTDCTHLEDIAVICETGGVTPTPVGPVTTRPPATVQPSNCGSNTTPGAPTNGDVRIIGPRDLNGTGFLEVYYNGQWGSICDDFWGTANARVVCRQLCFDPNVARAGAPVEVNYVRQNVSSNIFLDDVRCRGDETRISQCNNSAWLNDDCTTNEIVSVSCVQLDESPPPPPVPVLECENGVISASFSRQRDSNLEEKHLEVFSGACADASKSTDDNFVTINIPFDRCNTNVTTNETHLVYSNVVRYLYTRFEGEITRVNTYRVEVACEFPRDLMVSNVMRPLTETVTQTAPGQFGIVMIFFRNNSFNTPVQNYPLELTLGEWLNVAVNLVAVDDRQKLVVPNCTATPSVAPADSVNYPLFESKCANDQTLAFFPLNATSFGFRYQTFKFINYELVYIHCKAVVCLLSEKDEQCDRSCNSTTPTAASGRKKRDTSDTDRPYVVYDVISPALRFRKNGNDSNAIIREWNTSSHENASTTRIVTTRQPLPTSSPTTSRPTTQSTSRPTTQSTKPTTQSTRPTTPSTNPTTQSTRPTTPSTNPTTQSTSRPTTTAAPPPTTKTTQSTRSTTTTQKPSSTPTTTQQPTTRAETTRVTTSSPTTASPKTPTPTTKSVSKNRSKLYTTRVTVTAVSSSTDSTINKDNNFDFNQPFVAGLGSFVRGVACQTLSSLSTVTSLFCIHILNHMLQ